MSEPGFASLGPTLLARKGGAKPAMRPQVAPLVADETTPIADDQLEDLGWNDMGHDDDDDTGLTAGADIVPINGDICADQITAAGLAVDGGPIVRRQQRRLEERVLADAAMTGPEDREPEYDAEDEVLYGVDYAGGYDAPGEDEDDEDGAFAGGDDYAAAATDFIPLAPPVVSAPARSAGQRPVRVPAVQAGRRAAFTLRLDADRHLKLRLAATMQGVSAQALVTEALDRLLAEYGELEVIASHLKRH
jgi:hypothetical protein